MSLFLLLLLVSATPDNDTLTDRCDLVIVNHVYDKKGLVLSQLVFVEYKPALSNYEVIAYRMLHDNSALPQRDWRTGEYVCRYFESKRPREIRCSNAIVYRDIRDLEQLARDELDWELREGLSQRIERARYSFPPRLLRKEHIKYFLDDTSSE